MTCVARDACDNETPVCDRGFLRCPLGLIGVNLQTIHLCNPSMHPTLNVVPDEVLQRIMLYALTRVAHEMSLYTVGTNGLTLALICKRWHGISRDMSFAVEAFRRLSDPPLTGLSLAPQWIRRQDVLDRVLELSKGSPRATFGMSTVLCTVKNLGEKDTEAAHLYGKLVAWASLNIQAIPSGPVYLQNLRWLTYRPWTLADKRMHYDLSSLITSAVRRLGVAPGNDAEWDFLRAHLRAVGLPFFSAPKLTPRPFHFDYDTQAFWRLYGPTLSASEVVECVWTISGRIHVRYNAKKQDQLNGFLWPSLRSETRLAVVPAIRRLYDSSQDAPTRICLEMIFWGQIDFPHAPGRVFVAFRALTDRRWRAFQNYLEGRYLRSWKTWPVSTIRERPDIPWEPLATYVMRWWHGHVGEVIEAFGLGCQDALRLIFFDIRIFTDLVHKNVKLEAAFTERMVTHLAVLKCGEDEDMLLRQRWRDIAVEFLKNVVRANGGNTERLPISLQRRIGALGRRKGWTAGIDIEVLGNAEGRRRRGTTPPWAPRGTTAPWAPLRAATAEGAS
jgi:hypothetical protein